MNILDIEHNDIFDRKIFIWLDAHGGAYKWPLREEVSFFTRKIKTGYILIDDFKVPDLSCFGYDSYNGQVCSFDYIKEDINPDLQYHLEYPTYTERTSTFHPLRGWGLFTIKGEIK